MSARSRGVFSRYGRRIWCFFFFFQAEDGIRDLTVTGVQTCALPILGISDVCACGVADRDVVARVVRAAPFHLEFGAGIDAVGPIERGLHFVDTDRSTGKCGVGRGRTEQTDLVLARLYRRLELECRALDVLVAAVRPLAAAFWHDGDEVPLVRTAGDLYIDRRADARGGRTFEGRRRHRRRCNQGQQDRESGGHWMLPHAAWLAPASCRTT